MAQRPIHTYDDQGVYKGVMLASDEQFAESELVEGVAPLPAEPKAEDYTLESWQFHTMIEEAGLDTQINQAINNLPDDIGKKAAKHKLGKKLFFQRNDPLVVSLSAALSLTPEEVDVLWLQAKDLV